MGRKQTESTKLKISESLKGRQVGYAAQVNGKSLVPIQEKICKNCKQVFSVKRWRKTAYCSRTCGSSKNGGVRPNAGKRGAWYFCKEMSKNVYLDSTWEVEYATYLDKNDIRWVRPEYFVWIDSNSKMRKYYPDFLLIESQTYVDVKNDYLIKKDKEKISLVEQQNSVIINVLSRKDLDTLFAGVVQKQTATLPK